MASNEGVEEPTPPDSPEKEWNNSRMVALVILVVLVILYHHWTETHDRRHCRDSNRHATDTERRTFTVAEIQKISRERGRCKSTTLMRSALQGAVRGALIGFLLVDIRGAVKGAAMLGVLGPLVVLSGEIIQ